MQLLILAQWILEAHVGVAAHQSSGHVRQMVAGREQVCHRIGGSLDLHLLLRGRERLVVGQAREEAHQEHDHGLGLASQQLFVGGGLVGLQSARVLRLRQGYRGQALTHALGQ